MSDFPDKTFSKTHWGYAISIPNQNWENSLFVGVKQLTQGHVVNTWAILYFLKILCVGKERQNLKSHKKKGKIHHFPLVIEDMTGWSNKSGLNVFGYFSIESSISHHNHL